MTQTAQSATKDRFGLKLLAVWVVVGLLILAAGAANITQGRFPDPDDTLRLVQVRDLLAGQGWFDLHQYRINPPEGTLSHWSRLVDLPLAAMIGLLTPLFGSGLAERITLIAVPLLTLGAILLVVGHLARRMLDAETAIFACLCIGLIGPLVFQLQPYRIDHHGLQVLSVAAALWALAHPSNLRGGLIAGLAMAAGAIISIEILPMAAVFGSVFALRWLRDPARKAGLVGYMASLAIGLIALFLALRGPGDLAPHCDVIAPSHLAFFAVAAIGTALIARFAPERRSLMVAAFALTGLAGAATFASIAPGCVSSPFGSLHPEVRKFWFDNVAEGLPVWKQSLDRAIPTMLQMLVAFGAAIALIRRHEGVSRLWWTEFAIVLAGAILAGVLTYRSMAFAGVVAAIPLGWLAVQMFARMREASNIAAKLASVAVICLVLLPAAPLIIAEKVMPELAEMSSGKASAKDGNATAGRVELSRCELRANAPLLNALPPGTIFAPLDIGPSIIERSHHGVVATGHHRANDAMRDVILTFSGPAEKAEATIRAHQADYVVMCTDLAEVALYAARADESLAAQLIADRPPHWLKSVRLDAPHEFAVWKVVPSAN